MRRQPKYSLFKNSSYALKGLKDIVANETSFKIELFLLVPVLFVIYFVDITLTDKLFLFVSYFLVLIGEAANSAIERTVDLVTLDHHRMAGKAKDAGSTVVFLLVIQAIVVWGTIFYQYFF